MLGVSVLGDLKLDADPMSSDDKAGVSRPPYWRSAHATQLFINVNLAAK